MRGLATTAAAAVIGLAFAPAVTAGHDASTPNNLVSNPGFERAAVGWSAIGGARLSATTSDARVGGGALRVRVTRRGTVGVVTSLAAARLREHRLYSPVTGTLDATFRASAWVRGRGSTLGKTLRLQLNEFGGVRAEEPLEDAAAAVRLARRWQRVSFGGSVEANDRTGVAALAFLDDGDPGDVFHVDDYRVSGTAPERGPPATASDRWPWWAYLLVWAAVLASGAAWLVYSRRPVGKTI